MPDASPRVIVLARPGEACDRLQDAVRNAGAELVGAFDPLAATVEAVAGIGPQAVVVALEPAVEDALDGFQPLLADPAITVVFDEAELAAQRTGWDAARWVRHLAAKLHRHDDVLPPGAGQDTGLVLDDTPLAFDAGYRDVSHSDIELVAEEMRAHADEVPRDEVAPLDAAVPGFEEVVLASDGPVVETGSLDELALGGLTLEDVAPATAEDVDGASGGFGALTLEGVSLDDLVLDDDSGVDSARTDHASGREYLEPVDLTWDAEPARSEDAGAPTEQAPAAAVLDTGSLSLADPETPVVVPSAAPVKDALVDLDSRIGGLSLVDVDSYGFGELQGVVLVEGGLGGPDPVRQLLAALPEDFPRALLVRLRLDGDRYDRLVRQMARATTLPVALAEEGGAVERGNVYFLPPLLGVAAERGRLCFVTSDEAAATRLPDALPASDSAVVFLSGADAALVNDAMGAGWSGALVVGQSLDGCYDAAASARVAEQGGTLAAPTELANLLVERWAPGATAGGIELETSDE
ncbi:hypothetical protein E4582_07965 [Luteimonas yindakuii]|uniref:CheB-type methylesterase domain-containing protein n=1 Tax=Luteimonas yindakuii TaxID=2565782 RepID=A0A4Z1RM77_9GAMM|nr:chemotaxis protein CheB [Luteimonas yindakuii]TKS54701.1 hypothetical protein E4582_07965 [Luteimonas yindakuii]